MTRPQIVTFGPFTNGVVNKVVDPSVATKDLLVCDNFDIDPRGFLKTRPGASTLGTQTAITNNPTLYPLYANGNTLIFYADTGANILICTYLGTTIKSFTKTTAVTFSAVMYGGYTYVVSSNASYNSGYVDSSNVWTNTSYPNGVKCIVHKQRLFIIGTSDSTVYFSDPIDPANPSVVNFPATNFFTVGFKDGDNLKSIEIFNDSLLIFKDNSTWVFDFDADPAGGILRCLSTTIGVSNPHATTEYLGTIYLYHPPSGGYVLDNYTFTPLTDLHKISISGSFTDAYVSTLADRIVFKAVSTSDCHVFYPKVKAWTTWSGTVVQNFSWFFPYVSTGNYLEFFSGGNQSAYTLFEETIYNLEKYQVPFGSSSIIGFTATLQTIFYDIDSPMMYKKLLHWGLECSGVFGGVNSNIELFGGNTLPGTTHVKTHQNQVDHLVNSQPFASGQTVRENRYKAGYRFNQVSFEFSVRTAQTISNTNIQPFELYYIYAVISQKAISEKAVN